MDMTDYVKEFRALQKTHKLRVADYCREHILDVYKIRKLPAKETDGSQG